jgi:hypothetical protein
LASERETGERWLWTSDVINALCGFWAVLGRGHELNFKKFISKRHPRWSRLLFANLFQKYLAQLSLDGNWCHNVPTSNFNWISIFPTKAFLT